MSVEVGGGGLGSIYVGDKLVAGGGGGGEVKGRTFTITWQEKSDMSSGWTYSDDAAGLTAGSSAFDAFFGYSGVRLSSAGKETAWTGQTQPGTLDITKLGTLTSGDNVMIKFPLRGIKMTKSGSNVTLSITDEPNKKGYQYYAFTRNGKICTNLYISTYKCCHDSSDNLHSWSGQGFAQYSTSVGVGGYKSLEYYRQHSQSIDGGDGTGLHGYNIMSLYQRYYINALYMMKYGNPNILNVVGKGYTNNSNPTTTGGTNNQTSATYGTTSNYTTQMKLFGLEDWIGNYSDALDGAYVIGSWYSGTGGGILRVSTTGTLTNTTWDANVFDITIPIGESYNYLSSIVGDNESLFIGNSFNGSLSYYYSKWNISAYSEGVLETNSNKGTKDNSNLFNLNSHGVSQGGQAEACRLVYL